MNMRLTVNLSLKKRPHWSISWGSIKSLSFEAHFTESIPRKPSLAFIKGTNNMDRSLIFVSAKLCYTASQLVFDFDFDPIQNFVPPSQIDISIFCVLSLQNKLFFCVFHASAKRGTANKKSLFCKLTFSLNMLLCPVRHIFCGCIEVSCLVHC